MWKWKQLPWNVTSVGARAQQETSGLAADTESAAAPGRQTNVTCVEGRIVFS